MPAAGRAPARSTALPVAARGAAGKERRRKGKNNNLGEKNPPKNKKIKPKKTKATKRRTRVPAAAWKRSKKAPINPGLKRREKSPPRGNQKQISSHLITCREVCVRVCAARRAAASPASALPPPRPPRRERSGPGRGRPGAGSGAQRAGRRREGGEEKRRAAPPGEPSPSGLPPAARPRCPPPPPPPRPGAPGRSPLSPRRQRASTDVRPSAGCALRAALRGKRPVILPCFPEQKQ